MNHLKTIRLEGTEYEQYLAGNEVMCEATHLTTRDVREGEHVMVYKDTVANHTNVSVPRREMQSEYIGVEGMVTGIRRNGDHYEGVMIRKV